jgi:hypothetical protein
MRHTRKFSRNKAVITTLHRKESTHRFIPLDVYRLMGRHRGGILGLARSF